jgi:hypothetical protein
MPVGVKIIFTVCVAMIGVAVCFIDPKADNAGPDWMWRGGRNDGFRNLACKSDGTLRRHTKVGILIWFAIFIGGMWLFA